MTSPKGGPRASPQSHHQPEIIFSDFLFSSILDLIFPTDYGKMK